MIDGVHENITQHAVDSVQQYPNTHIICVALRFEKHYSNVC